ncbi:MAG: acyl-CoA thioesterase [Candidatus Stahlbacteria bacterium]|nr:acyl-CoA thioesterase [Candidatus Stahlbacteria bacterium]
MTSELLLRVSYADTDQMGIVYYARYFEYFERGRTELLRELGVPYSEMEKKGISLPVIEAYCEYKKGIKYDEIIIIKTYLKDPPTAWIRMDYEVLNETKDKVLAKGYTRHPFVNQHGKPVRPPKEFVKQITAGLLGYEKKIKL